MAHVEEPVDFFEDEYDERSRAATSTREDNMYSFWERFLELTVMLQQKQ
ncbi:6745_t:CDS:1, partial [Acaulospora morrowiae]